MGNLGEASSAEEDKLAAKVLLVNPNRMKPVVTPVALDYLAQALEQQGIPVDILDLAFAEDPAKAMDELLSKENYLFIAVTVRNIDDSYFASQDFCLKKTRDIIDQIRSRTETPIILGGVGFSVIPELTLAYCRVEMGIKGEGEWSLAQLAKKMGAGKGIRDIPGLIFKEGKHFQKNPVPYGPLQDLTLSRRDSFDNLRYFQEGGMVGFETKRGCDQTCTYCADPLSKGSIIRFRNPKDVAAELAHLYRKGIDHFHTCDSEFNIPEEQAIDVCKEVVNQQLGEKIRWYAYASPTPFRDELAYWMKRAGCVGIDFGVDHGNNFMLRRLGRAHQAEDLRKIGRRARNYGFSFMFDLLLGGPGETFQTIQETIDLMKEVSPDRVGISLGVRLYRGTGLAREVSKQGVFCAENPNLHGVISGNEGMLQPVFYLSPELAEDGEEFLERQIAGDSRFLMGNRTKVDRNYNYNENSRLMEAIKQGYRGAFWDILRRAGN